MMTRYSNIHYLILHFIQLTSSVTLAPSVVRAIPRPLPTCRPHILLLNLRETVLSSLGTVIYISICPTFSRVLTYQSQPCSHVFTSRDHHWQRTNRLDLEVSSGHPCYLASLIVWCEHGCRAYSSIIPNPLRYSQNIEIIFLFIFIRVVSGPWNFTCLDEQVFFPETLRAC